MGLTHNLGLFAHSPHPFTHSPTLHTWLLKGEAVVHALEAPNPHGWLVEAHKQGHEGGLATLPCQLLGPLLVASLQGGWVKGWW